MKNKNFGLLSLLFCSCTTIASQANELEGPVTMVGSAPNARPILSRVGDKNQTNICPGAQQDYLRKFSGTIVKLNGEWSEQKETKERCFEVKSFHVTQVTQGRPAFIGLLKKEDTKFVIEADDGKRYTLEAATKGLRELAGKRVITDLVPAGQTSDTKGSEGNWKIVSYMEYPAP